MWLDGILLVGGMIALIYAADRLVRSAATVSRAFGVSAVLIGAVIIGILDKGLNQYGVHFSAQFIVKGLVVLAAVYIDVRRRK